MSTQVTFMFRGKHDNCLYFVTARHLDETYLVSVDHSKVVRCYTSEFEAKFQFSMYYSEIQ